MSRVIYTMEELETLQKELPDFTARTYRRGGFMSSIVFNDVVVKHARSFNTVERAERVYDAYKKKGFKGAPSSPASIFRATLEKQIEEGRAEHPATIVPDDLQFDTGGATWLWIESLVPSRSTLTCPVSHYDINEAFWSAFRMGLPSTFFPYSSGDKHYVARAHVNSAEKEIPWFFETSGPNLITGSDVRYYGLDVDIIDGITYVDLDVSYESVMEEIGESFGPWIAKRARQMSWGTFVMNDGIKCASYKDGEKRKEWTQHNRFACRPWGVIITRRIMRKVHRAIEEGDGVSLFVDSVLTRNELQTSDAVGDWRKEKDFSEGVHIVAPGIYDGVPRTTPYVSSSWYRHAGVSKNGTPKYRPDISPGQVKDKEERPGVERSRRTKEINQVMEEQYGSLFDTGEPPNQHNQVPEAT